MRPKTIEEKIEYQIAKLNNLKSEFIDSSMFDICYRYINEVVISYTFTPKFKVNLCRNGIILCEEFKDIITNELSWSDVCRIAKTGGVCIKSSMFHECSNDAITNEFYCAYGVCPNIYHFYYMANISYRQAKELVDGIKINKTHNQLRHAQKELNKLNTIVSNKLMPELIELKHEVNTKGIPTILSKHQDLEYIITHYDEIFKEISLWKNISI